jgi:hypothetical protein
MATAEFRRISNCTTAKAPTETDYDRTGGTFCSHWDEVCMGSELMTGFLEKNDDETHPLSRITIAGLGDLGYTVDYTTADPYTVDNLDDSCHCVKTTPPPRTRQLSHALLSYRKQQLRSTPSTEMGVYQFGLFEDDAMGKRKSQRRQHRRISEEAHQMATTYGLHVLAERRKDQQTQKQFVAAITNNSSNSTTASTDTATRYIGDQVISILIEDDGEIYGVMVVNPDVGS